MPSRPGHAPYSQEWRRRESITKHLIMFKHRHDDPSTPRISRTVLSCVYRNRCNWGTQRSKLNYIQGTTYRQRLLSRCNRLGLQLCGLHCRLHGFLASGIGQQPRIVSAQAPILLLFLLLFRWGWLVALRLRFGLPQHAQGNCCRSGCYRKNSGEKEGSCNNLRLSVCGGKWAGLVQITLVTSETMLEVGQIVHLREGLMVWETTTDVCLHGDCVLLGTTCLGATVVGQRNEEADMASWVAAVMVQIWQHITRLHLSNDGQRMISVSRFRGTVIVVKPNKCPILADRLPCNATFYNPKESYGY